MEVSTQTQLLSKFKSSLVSLCGQNHPRDCFLPTLLFWGLRTLKDRGKPAPNTLGEHRFEPHFGLPGLLFSPVQSQGTLPRTTGQVDRFLPGQAHLRSDTESGGQPPPPCCVTRHHMSPLSSLLPPLSNRSFHETHSVPLPPNCHVVSCNHVARRALGWGRERFYFNRWLW